MSTGNMDIHDHSCGQDWYFLINGYMQPYSETGAWANDWLESDIYLITENQTIHFKLNHLLIEELEDLRNWLTILKNEMPVCRIFQFVDPELCFEIIESNQKIMLRLTYGLEEDNQIIVENPISNESSLLDIQIARIEKLLNSYICRCKMEHNLFRKTV